MGSVYCINWTEHERGWGQRPDGHTLHASRENADAYLADFIARQPAEARDEYSRPGKPFLVEVHEDVFDLVQAKGWVWGHHRQQLPLPSSTIPIEE